jgi:hypothetical protein
MNSHPLYVNDGMVDKKANLKRELSSSPSLYSEIVIHPPI